MFVVLSSPAPTFPCTCITYSVLTHRHAHTLCTLAFLHGIDFHWSLEPWADVWILSSLSLLHLFRPKNLRDKIPPVEVDGVGEAE